MAEIDKTIARMKRVLEEFERSIELYGEQEDLFKKEPSIKNKEYFMAMRDSAIHRFEFSVDLLLDFLKVYLSDVEQIPLNVYSPRSLLRENVRIRVISEQECLQIMEMLDNFHLTCHTYQEKMAVLIAKKIPDYYILMHTITNRLKVD